MAAAAARGDDRGGGGLLLPCGDSSRGREGLRSENRAGDTDGGGGGGGCGV